MPPDSVWNKAKRRAREILAITFEPATKALRRDAEIDYLKSLPTIMLPPDLGSGVLLSDRIRELCGEQYKLIEPFSDSKLKPAAYELSVGGCYSIGGETFQLPDDPEAEIVIDPFEVVIIQTLERLNMPDFLIARWNVRTRWAYKGLLWVGAAQVDPGFKGFLACPLYNLSNGPVRLHRGDEIAVIDFVTTTDPKTQPKTDKYDPLKRTRILFEDYEPNNLQSALATYAQQKVAAVEKEIKELKGRVDGSITTITTAIGILVAALALIVSRQVPDVVVQFSPVYLLMMVAVIIAMISYVHTTYRHITADKPRIARLIALEVGTIGLLVVIIWQLSRLEQRLAPTPPTAPSVTQGKTAASPPAATTITPRKH